MPDYDANAWLIRRNAHGGSRIGVSCPDCLRPEPNSDRTDLRGFCRCWHPLTSIADLVRAHGLEGLPIRWRHNTPPHKLEPVG
jgi:hypothetical protein